MEEDIKRLSNVEIIKELSFLDQKIELDIIRYNKLLDELCMRFPIFNESEDFKPKVKSLGGIPHETV